MKSIIWKELRENVRWSLLAFLGMCVAMAVALQPDVRSLTIVSRNLHSVASEDFQLVTAVGCAVVGFALGLLQVVFEARGDRYALLVHRPASRSALFAAKVLAGGVLYLFPTAVPFLLASWWAATPGHIPAPFAGSMMLPGATDILLGFAYYFAGVLTGLREARWYASRSVGVVTAAFLSCLTVVVSSFMAAVVLALAGITLLAVAAWGCFLAGGAFRSQPLVSRIAAGVCLVVALGLALSAACFGLAEAARELRLGGRYRPQETVVSGGHTILRDGRVIANGRTIDGEDAELAPEVRPAFVGLVVFPGFPLAPSSYRFRRRFPVLRTVPNRIWFHDPEVGSILQYTLEDAQIRFGGYVDPETLTLESERPAKRLEYLGDTSEQWRFTPGTAFWWGGSRVVVFTTAVYELHATPPRALLTIPEGGDPIIAGGHLRERHDRGRWIPPFAFATLVSERELVVLQESGEVILRTAMVPDASRFQSVGVAPLDGDRFAVYFTARLGADPYTATEGDEVIRIVAASGEVLEEHRLAPKIGYGRARWLLSDYAGPGTPFPAMVLAGLEARLRADATYSIVLERWWLFGLLSLVSALGAYALARRQAFSTRSVLLWTGLAFLLGPVGLLTFLCLEDWPARERCHSCGRPRVVSREECELCGATWPAPQSDGTEVFEAA